MSRVLALDIGTVRIGAAISDLSGVIAQGLGVWKIETWRKDFDDCIKKYNPVTILIGLPVRTDGTYGEACDNVKKILAVLQKSYPDKKFVTWDERFTTVIAQNVLISADVSRKTRRKHVDKIAAVLILESWLEFNRDKF